MPSSSSSLEHHCHHHRRLAHGVVVGRVIYNASTMGYDIAVVVKTLRVKEKNERVGSVGSVGIVMARRRLVLTLLEDLSQADATA